MYVEKCIAKIMWSHKEVGVNLQTTPLFENNNEVGDDDDTDTCNMCGGSGFLDLEQTQECPNCNGSGNV